MAIERSESVCWIRSDNLIGVTLLPVVFGTSDVLFPTTTDPETRRAFAQRAVQHWCPQMDALTAAAEIQKCVRANSVWSVPVLLLQRRPRESVERAAKRHADTLLPPDLPYLWSECTEAQQKARLSGVPIPLTDDERANASDGRITVLEAQVVALTARIEALENK
jgi:hypothetical protein